MSPARRRYLLFVPRIFLPLVTGYIEAMWALSMKICTQAVLTYYEDNNFRDAFTWVAFVLSMALAILKVVTMNFSFHYFP